VAQSTETCDPPQVARGDGQGNSKTTETRRPEPTTTALSVPSTVEPEAWSAARSRLAQRRGSTTSQEEAEVAYVAARDAWTAAMHASASGRSADLASLALAQEAYEAAAAEREIWLSAPASTRAIPVDPSGAKRDIEIVVGQGAKWQRVKDHEPVGGVRGLLKRLFGD
jgi:hypothetical protein